MSEENQAAETDETFGELLERFRYPSCLPDLVYGSFYTNGPTTWEQIARIDARPPLRRDYEKQ